MFITKKHLTRRTVLRGVGTALGLPLLDAMIPARTALAQTAAKATPHLGFIYFPHGAVMNQWTPTGEGTIGEFGDILKPLDKYKAMTTVFSNIDNQAPVGPVHALSPGTWLSCVHPAISQEAHGGTTADQIAAQHIGQDTPLPSLEVATDNPRRRRLLRSRLRLLLRRNDFVPHAHHAAADGDRSAQAVHPLVRPGRQRRRARAVVEAVRVAARHGHERGQRAAAQPGAVRQARCSPIIWKASARSSAAFRRWKRAISRTSTSPTPRRGTPPFDQHINLMFDLVALAYQANMTRVFSFMMAAEVSGQTYNHIGVSDAFHPLSHHNNEPAKMDRLVKVQTYHTQVFAKFLDKLAKMPDGDGTMLDHSLFLYGSNMSNSNAHNHYPLPTSIVGGWKTVKGGQHLVPPEHTPLANVLLTMLDRVGVTQDKLGDSTGKLVEV